MSHVDMLALFVLLAYTMSLDNQGLLYMYYCSFQEHTNFVNCVRFSPSGSQFCTASSDRTAFLYDGKTGEKIGALGGGDGAHKGGIYSVS